MNTNDTIKIPEVIHLPEKIIKYETDSGILYIAPSIGSAIVVDKVGEYIFELFKKGVKSEEALKSAIKYFQNKDGVFKTFVRLVGQIYLEQFLSETEPYISSFEDEEKILHLHLTRSCNLNCIHCYVDAGCKVHRELVFESWKKIIDFYAPYVRSITFSGGEPLLKSFTIKLAEYTKKQYNKKLNLYTNGTLIDSEKKANLIASNFSEVQISLDGATQEVVENIRGKGSYKKILHGIKLLTQCNIPELTLAVCIFPSNIDDLLENLIKLLEEIDPYKKIRSVRLGEIKELGRANSMMVMNKSKENSQKLYELQQKILATGRRVEDVYSEKRFFDYYTFDKGKQKKISTSCGFGKSIIVDSNGDLYPCSIMTDKAKIGNFFDKLNTDFYTIWKDSYRNYLVDKIESCKDCDIRYFCFGGCRIQRTEISGKLNDPHCTEDFKKQQINRIAENIVRKFSRSSGEKVKRGSVT